MAKPTPELIEALRKTAQQLQDPTQRYMWGHMGSCNCGHLAQNLTQLSAADIHAFALERHGNWEEQTLDYCPTSGYPLDAVIETMLAAGLTLNDLRHLERLDDEKILAWLPGGKRFLNRNQRQDAAAYLQAWALKLEAESLAHLGQAAALQPSVQQVPAHV